MVKNDSNVQEDTIDLKTIFRLFLRRKWWFIGTFLVVLVAGMLYMLSKPMLYEVRYKFNYEDDFLPDDYLMYSESQESQKLFSNESVFIEAADIPLIFETELIFRSLLNIEEIDDYSDYIRSPLIELDMQSDTSIFVLRIKNTDKGLADDIAKNLIESLGIQVMDNDLEILSNTLVMIDKDIKLLEEENMSYENKIAALDEEKEKGEILLYRERMIDNEYEIEKLAKLYGLFEEEKGKVHNRVEIISANPDYKVENDRMINSIIVILLSLLTGIVVVLVVNYIYKLKENKKS
ncbi:hypothetical protein ACFLQQ_01310 [Actinomycetota bacterium]